MPNHSIFSISSHPMTLQSVDMKTPQTNVHTESEKFGTYLKKAIDEVNQAQIKSDDMTMKLIAGENVDLHEVMITAQKASITLQTAIELRNKAVEAYQEMMRMQV